MAKADDFKTAGEQVQRLAVKAQSHEPTAEAVCACGEKQSDSAHAPDPGREPWVKGRHPFAVAEPEAACARCGDSRRVVLTQLSTGRQTEEPCPDCQEGKCEHGIDLTKACEDCFELEPEEAD